MEEGTNERGKRMKEVRDLTGREAVGGSKDKSRRRRKNKKINDETIEKNDRRKHECYGEEEIQQL
jgi:hypothetical protein